MTQAPAAPSGATPDTEASDAELISRVRGGDVDAYGDLFERHRDAANRLARQLLPGPDADDLVAEAFIKVMNVLLAGGGPDVALRPYLLTAVRRLHVDKIRANKRAMPTDDLTPYDPGVPFSDTVVAGFEGGAAAQAFASLPERWQLVLWHLEVEGQKPADIAPLLGMSANSVSALAYRAREGLRQAFLQMHTADLVENDCKWTHDKLGAYVRQGLARRDNVKVEAHLDGCRKCTAIFLELRELNSELAALLGPIVLGTAAAGYLGAAATGVVKGGIILGFFGAAKDKLSNPAVAAAAAMAMVLAAAGGIAMVKAGGDDPAPPAAADKPAPPSDSAPPADSAPPTAPPAAPPAAPVPAAVAPTTAPTTAPSPSPSPSPTPVVDGVAPSAPTNFRTSAPIPARELTGGRMTVAARTMSVTASWTSSRDNEAVVGYDIYANGSVVAKAGGNASSMKVTGLADGETYRMYGVARDEAGNVSDRSNTVTLVIPDSTDPTVSGIKVTDATQHSLSFAWSGSDNVGVTGYSVTLREADSPLSLGRTQEGTSPSATFEGLLPGTAYTVSIVAHDAAGNESPAATKTASTDAVTTPDSIPPDTPANVTISNETETSFHVSWDASTDASGIDHYTVFVDGKAYGTSKTSSLTVDGRTPDTTYGVTVTATDASPARNTSAPSAAASATTLPVPLPTPIVTATVDERGNSGKWDVQLSGEKVPATGVDVTLHLDNATWLAGGGCPLGLFDCTVHLESDGHTPNLSFNHLLLLGEPVLTGTFRFEGKTYAVQVDRR